MEKAHPDLALLVERLPLSFFDAHAHYALNFGGLYTADIHINGGSMRLSTFFALGAAHDDPERTYQTVHFVSDEAFEQHLKFVVRRIQLAKN